MSVNVKGTLRDPMSNRMPNTIIRFTSTQGHGEMVAPTFAMFSTDGLGQYNFNVVDGVYYIEVLQQRDFDLDEYEIIGESIINAGTPSPVTLGQLLQYTTPIPPQDLIELEDSWDNKFNDLVNHHDTVTQDLTTQLVDGDTYAINQMATYSNEALGSQMAIIRNEVAAGDANATNLMRAYTDEAGNELASDISRVETSASSAQTDLTAYKKSNGDALAQQKTELEVADGKIVSDMTVQYKAYTDTLELRIENSLTIGDNFITEELSLVKNGLDKVTSTWQIATTVDELYSSIAMINDGETAGVYIQANEFKFYDVVGENKEIYSPFSIVDGIVYMDNVVLGSSTTKPLYDDLTYFGEDSLADTALTESRNRYTYDTDINSSGGTVGLQFQGQGYDALGHVSVLLKASDSYVCTSDGVSTILFTAYPSDSSGLSNDLVEWEVTPSSVLTTDNGNNTLSLSITNAGYHETIRVTAKVNGMEDYINIIFLPEEGVTALINNEHSNYALDEAGNELDYVHNKSGSLSGSIPNSTYGKFYIFDGHTQISANAASGLYDIEYKTINTSGLTASISTNGYYRASSIAGDRGTATFSATWNGVTYKKTITVDRVREGKHLHLDSYRKTFKVLSETGTAFTFNNKRLPTFRSNTGIEKWHSFKTKILSSDNNIIVPKIIDGSKVLGIVVTEGGVGNPEGAVDYANLYPQQSKVDIRSYDYVPLESGWAIWNSTDDSGESGCEFTNGIFRGDLHAKSLTLYDENGVGAVTKNTDVLNSEVSWDTLGDVPDSIDNAKVVPYNDDWMLHDSVVQMRSSNYYYKYTNDTVIPIGERDGWGIHVDGMAVFQNAFVSGEIYATKGTLNKVTIEEDCLIKGKLTAGSARITTFINADTGKTNEAPFNIFQYSQKLDNKDDKSIVLDMPLLKSPYASPVGYSNLRVGNMVTDLIFDITYVSPSGHEGGMGIRVFVSYDGGAFNKLKTYLFTFVQDIGTVPFMFRYTTRSSAWTTVQVRVEGYDTGGDNNDNPVMMTCRMSVNNTDVSGYTQSTFSGSDSIETPPPPDGTDRPIIKIPDGGVQP